MEPESKTKPTPIYETVTKEGTHIVVSEDLEKKGPIKTGMDIAKGKIPSNVEIVETLDKTKEVLEEERKHNVNLSLHGQKLAKDTEELLQSTKQWVLEKNEEDALQKAFIEGWTSGNKTAEMVELTGTKVTTPPFEMRKEFAELINGFRSLTWSVVRSSDVRDLVFEGLDLVQFLVEQGKEAIATGSLPLPGTSNAPSSPLIDIPLSPPTSVGRTEAPSQQTFGQVPFAPYSVPSTAPPSSSSFGAPTSFNAPPSSSFGAPGAPSSSSFGAPTSSSSFLAPGAPSSGPVVGQAPPTGEKSPQKEAIKSEVTQKFSAFFERLGSKPEYQEIVTHFLRLSSFFFNWTKETALMTPVETKHLHECLKNLRKFVKGFVGSQELSAFRFTFWGLWEELSVDEELKNWGEEFASFLRTLLKDPQLWTKQETQDRANLLFGRLKGILQNERYKERVLRLMDEGRAMLYNLRNDQTSTNFQKKFKQLVTDMTTNVYGKPDMYVMDKSFDQLKFLLLPMVKKFLSDIPIDRIDIWNKDYSLTVRDIRFDGLDILPQFMNLYADNRFTLEFKPEMPSSSLNRFWVDIQGIKPEFKNMKFHYKRHAVPHIEDEGTADVKFSGHGIRIWLVWQLISEEGKATRVELKRARCKIDNISIHVGGETKHAWIDKILISLLSARIKSTLSNSIESYLYSNAHVVNDQINEFFSTRPLDSLKQQLNVKLQSIY